MKTTLWTLFLCLFVVMSCKKDKNASPQFGTVTDLEGNVYKTVKIGDQWWMAENLKTLKLNDGTAIPLVTSNQTWVDPNISSPMACYPNNDFNNMAAYGLLYNWSAVNTGKLAPQGWHVATDLDWTELTNYLGGEAIASDKLREKGSVHWASPNTGATNSSGFSALASGLRSFINGEFAFDGTIASFWTTLENDVNQAWERDLNESDPKVYRVPFPKKAGLSVRCVKD